MTFRFSPSQLAVCQENFLNSLFEAGPSLVKGRFLDVAPRQLLDEPRPPVAYLLKDSCVLVFHGLDSPTNGWWIPGPVAHPSNTALSREGLQAVGVDLAGSNALFYAPCEDARHSMESFLPC